MVNHPDAQSLVPRLTEIVGADHIALSELSSSPRPHVPAPPRHPVVTPATTDELAACMAACHEARVPVVPYGGGTRQRWGHPPKSPFVVLRTTRLDRVLIYEPDDLTISVEAGMTLQALDELLAANGQMLPLDGPLPARATIGGFLATGADGPRRLGYGTARDMLIGVRVVEATGRVSKAGGMVVKNVSGFDMMKLYLGSLGTLAIIVSANFKLMPRPRAAASLLAACPAPEVAFALAEAIFASQLTPVAVEYLEGWDGAGLVPAAPCHLAMRAEGLPAAVERHLRDLTAMASAAGAGELIVLRDPAHTALWAALNDLPQTAEPAPDELLLRLSCLPGDLARALADARGRAAGLSLLIAARALSGVAYLRLRGPAAALGACYSELLRSWPQTIAIAVPPVPELAALPIWGAPPANLELMGRIKAEFDPQQLLNPGRYVV
jgi:glycolate oxidase FAD binding subunit